jgi:hypothetical protein
MGSANPLPAVMGEDVAGLQEWSMRILVAFGPSCPTTVPKNDAAISDPMRQYCCRLRSMLLCTKIQDVRTDGDGVYVLLNFGRRCSGGIFLESRCRYHWWCICSCEFIFISAVFALFFFLQFLVVRILNILYFSGTSTTFRGGQRVDPEISMYVKENKK